MTGPTHPPTLEVLRWGLPQLRDLPWRRTRDPWAVLVSEVMLQQTQVARVVPKWLAFLGEFPTTASCAAAPLGDVLRLWHGLGYPRRARNLHAAAAAITSAGAFPADLEGLLALPGVGPYTARAVLAFAYETDAAVVDTNVGRVLARVHGASLTPRRAQALADSWLPGGQAWAWNQCVLDLGASLCRATAPACGECPLRRRCAWKGRGPDPAFGSAGVSRAQARFEGSERQARGRLMAALTSGPVAVGDAARVMSHRAADPLVRALVSEGLVRSDGEVLRLP